MKVLITALTPFDGELVDAPRPMRAIHDFRAVGHTVYVATPIKGEAEEVRAALDVAGVLPIFPMNSALWGVLLLNIYRVSYWARRWRPEVYLSLGARAATMAHGARGATGGYGLSVLVLPALRFQSGSTIGRLIEHRAIHECDRLITYDASFGEYLVSRCGARGGDLTLLPGEESDAFVTLCERYLTQPPGIVTDTSVA